MKKAFPFPSFLPMAAVLTALSTVQAVAAEAQTCSYPATGSVDLKLDDPTGVPANAYRTSIAILDAKGQSAGLQPVVIDTGSTGIVISQSKVPVALFNASQTLGQLFYSSSGDYLAGKVVNAAVALPANGEPATVQSNPIDILAASCACSINKGTAPSNKEPVNPADCGSYNNTAVVGGSSNDSLANCRAASDSMGMMGVGFDRGAQPTTATNPFLNVAMAVHPGYVITANGISIGLTQQNTAGFAMTDLDRAAYQPPAPALPNWNAPTACVAVGGSVSQQATSLCGSLLMDTGIDYMFLSFDSSKRPPNSSVQAMLDGSVRDIVKPGLFLEFTASNAHKATLLDFRQTAAEPIGGKPTVPVGQTVAVWVTPQTGNDGFINTGRRLLNYGSYLFDEGCGKLGFKASAAPATH